MQSNWLRSRQAMQIQYWFENNALILKSVSPFNWHTQFYDHFKYGYKSVLRAHFCATKEEASFARALLQDIALLPRFKTAIFFLLDNEKKIILQLFDSLSKVVSVPDSLRRAYCWNHKLFGKPTAPYKERSEIFGTKNNLEIISSLIIP